MKTFQYRIAETGNRIDGRNRTQNTRKLPSGLRFPVSGIF